MYKIKKPLESGLRDSESLYLLRGDSFWVTKMTYLCAFCVLQTPKVTMKWRSNGDDR